MFDKRPLSLYAPKMIQSFRNKALERLYVTGSGKALPSGFVAKIRRVLLALDEANAPSDLSQPGFGLHPLSGNMRGYWSIVITRNWRITFYFEGQDVCEVDFVDYH